MGSRGNNGGGGVKEIPEASRKMVRSLKEIVGCPETEIYAMLKECAMDPNEAVNRLLSQDPFHEVKSKREKKKENKNTTESKARGTNIHSSRGSRGGYNHFLGSSGTQFSSSESAYKKENGSNVYANHSSASSETTGNNVYHRPPAYSDPVTTEKKAVNSDTVDDYWSSSLPSSGLSQPSASRPVWGVPGQVSMADIVKMGRPHGRGSGSVNQSQSNMSHYNVGSSEVPISKVSPDDEWPVVEPSTRISRVVQPASGWHTDSSHLSSNAIDQHPVPEQDEVPVVEDEYVENVCANHDEYASVSSGRIQNNNSEGAYFNSDVHENVESHQPHSGAVEYREAEDVGVSVSSMASNLQQLDIVDDCEAQSEEGDAAVIIPDHLQVQTADCLHLSFGSFGSLNAVPAYSVPFSSRPTPSNLEEAHAAEDAPSVVQLDTRNSDYYVEESLRTASDGLVHRPSESGARAYDSPSVSHSKVLNQENHEAPHENQYTLPSSNYSFENTAQLNASFPPSQTSAQLQTFSNQAYTNTLPSSLLPTSAQSTRESDYPNSPFVMGQSTPSKYGSSVSSVSGSTVPIQEVLKAAGLTSTPQNVLGNNFASGPDLPQHLMHQYPQMAQLTNLMGYHQLMPQNYYLPGAYQQAFASNNAYHQSLGGMFPQYKNSVSVSSLPHSASVASGYGGNFGSSNSLPGNFPTNQPSPPGASAVGYEDLLSSQYRDTSHLLSLQQAQNDNQVMWLQGHGSRTISGVPANTYCNYQSQQQQPPAGFRQNQQQPSQNYGALGNLNPNFYDSQSGILLDHQQQQNSRDVQANKQAQHLWHNSY